MPTLAENIAARRAELGLTIYAAVKDQPITHPEWRRFEAGARLPTLPKLEVIAAILRCGKARLIRGTNFLAPPAGNAESPQV